VKQATADLLQFDRKHIWHPYTSIDNPLKVYAVDSAEGVRIKLQDGRELIDGMASWWSVIHGYNNPHLTKTLQDQAGKLAHVMFGGLTHEPAVELSKLLVKITPAPLDRVFLCDSGSVAVEVAMKMAIQYNFALGISGKNRFLTIKSGYHGDTFHAMSVCDPENGMHQIYSGILPEYYFADMPRCRFNDENFNLVLLEGAGGLSVPLHDDFTVLDYLETEKFPVILVSSSRLGSINHTLNALEIAQKRGLNVAAIIYNRFNDTDPRISRDSKEIFSKYLVKHGFRDCVIDFPAITEGNNDEYPIDFSSLLT